MEELRQAKNHIDVAMDILAKDNAEKTKGEGAGRVLRSQMEAFDGIPLSYLQHGPNGRKFKITVDAWEENQ